MTNIVFIDTETTGVHPERLPWEIAMVRREPNGDETTNLLQISPINLSKADPFGLKIGKFYERHVDFGDYNPPFTKIVSENMAANIVEDFTRDAHIIGAVPNFDTETLDPMLRRHGLIPAWYYHIIDVETLAIGYLMGKNQYDENPLHDDDPPHFNFKLPWKSDELSRAIGVEPPSNEERHTALGDVYWAMRTYDKVMGNA
jgi:hypothetical protein